MQSAGNVLTNFAKQQTVGQLQKNQKRDGIAGFSNSKHIAEHAYNQYQLQMIQQQQRARDQQINDTTGSVGLVQDDAKSLF